MNSKDKGIVLLSGGLDSTLVLASCIDRGDEVVPFFVDYNQWPVEKGRVAVKAVCTKLKVGSRHHEPVVYKVFQEGEERDRIGSVWGRSIGMIGLASMWAYTHGNDYDYIAIGVHEGDVGPDCQPGAFDEHMGAALQEATKFQLTLSIPIEDLSIEEIGISLKEYNIPFEMMYSCYWDPPCGYRSNNESYRCPGCRRKTLAMEAAGIIDQDFLDFPNGNKQARSYQSPLALSVEY